MGKKRVGRYSLEFRRIAVERMNGCHNITALAKELGLERKLLYLWREQLDPESVVGRKPGRKSQSREEELAEEVTRLKQVLADKTLELDFFKGALQKVEERRQRSKTTGVKTSTSTSGK